MLWEHHMINNALRLHLEVHTTLKLMHAHYTMAY